MMQPEMAGFAPGAAT